MTEPPTILPYASPPARRSVARFITPGLFATAAAIVAVSSSMLPLDVGSGRVILNPLRVLGCTVAVVCVLAYAGLRLWRDRSKGTVRAAVYGACLLVAAAAFTYAHWSRWGDPYKPRFSMRHDFSLQDEYWLAWLVFACAIAVAVLFGIARRIRQGRPSR